MAEHQAITRSPHFKDMMSEPPFGFLRVIGYAGNDNRNRARWTCLCDESLGGCGKTTVVAGQQLRSGGTKSCGCLIAKASREDKTTHGMWKTAEYRSWAAMKTRCTNPNSKVFADYGGRGIKVCERWLLFENFYADMGPKPDSGSTLDRIDSDGDYEPGNCRWATRETQSRNRRNNVLFTIDGETQCVSWWAKARGIPVQTVRARLRRGLPIEQALSS